MKLKLFNLNKDGKGVEPNEDTTPNIRYYFKSLWRKLSKLVSINLLAILQFVPLAVAFFAYFWSEKQPTLTDLTFPVFSGIMEMDPSPANQILQMLSSPQLNVPIPSIGMYATIGIAVLIFALFFGWCNVSFTYLMREMVNGRPVFIFSDIKHAIKRNAKQGFLFGLVDFLILFVLGINIYSMANSIAIGFMWDFLYIANVAIAIIYIIMRFYMYLMLVTFDMKIMKIFKNALIFVMLGIKRNVLAILWILVLLGINVLLIISFTPIGVILPILYIAAIPMFTTTYAAYPVIKRYMIDPSPYAEIEEHEETTETALFSDDTGISADEMWKMFLESGNVDADESYRLVTFDGDVDNKAKLVVSGEKTATSSAHPLYAAKEMSLPRVGEYSVILNSKAQAVCITQTTKVYVLPFQKITEEHAQLEGEGDKSLKHWSRTHKETFSQEMKKFGLSFSEDMRVVCEQFQVVYKPE